MWPRAGACKAEGRAVLCKAGSKVGDHPSQVSGESRGWKGDLPKCAFRWGGDEGLQVLGRLTTPFSGLRASCSPLPPSPLVTSVPACLLARSAYLSLPTPLAHSGTCVVPQCQQLRVLTVAGHSELPTVWPGKSVCCQPSFFISLHMPFDALSSFPDSTPCPSVVSRASSHVQCPHLHASFV